MSRYKKRKIKAPGIVVTVILLLMMIELVAVLAISGMIPMMALGIIGVVLLVIVIIDYLLVQDFNHKIRFILGTMLAILMIVIAVLGSLYLFKGMNTLAKISNANTETSHIGVYVLNDDPAQEIGDTAGYTYGILSQLDRDNTDDVLSQITEELTSTPATTEYDGLTDMIDGLLDQNCGAIILNEAYIPVLEDMDGYEDISSQIRELDIKEVETSVDVSEDTTLGENIIELYISGIDTRGSEIINTRSDVNIIAVINTDTKQVLLLSTPRDYFVPLSISNGQKDKLTHAGIYGTNVSMDTLDMLYDTQLQYYFKVNFAGFINIIDALGGITVHSDYTFSTGSYNFVEGDNTVYGEAALAFARERHAFEDGDKQRGKDQMAVIKGVINKMISPEMLINYSDVMDSMEGSFETSIPYSKITELVKEQLENPSTWNIVSYSVDGTDDSQIPYSMSTYAYVMNPDQATVDKAKGLIQQVINGETINLSE